MNDITNQLFWGLVAIGGFILVGFIYWVDSKKPREKTDPMQKGILLTVFLWCVLFLGEAVGFFEKGWNTKHWYVHICIAFVIVGIYLLVSLRKRAKTYEEQKRKVLDVIEMEYDAKVYQGGGFFPFLVAYKVTIENANVEATRGEVGNFLVLANTPSKSLFVFAQLNIYTLQLLHLQFDPPQEKLFELYGKSLPTKDQFVSQYDDSVEDVKQSNGQSG